VNLAIEKATGQQVAIKAVNIMRICELNKERHILREKELLHDLKHPNIIQLFTTFKDDKNLYFVFEIGPNGTLDDLIKVLKGNITEEIVKIMFAQLINF
jgi:serine/threonine protein kinase